MVSIATMSFTASSMMTRRLCATGRPTFSLLRAQHTDSIPMRKRDPRSLDLITRKMDEVMRRKIPRGINQNMNRIMYLADALNDISFARNGKLPNNRKDSMAAIRKTREVVSERLKVDEESDDPRWTADQRKEFRRAMKHHRLFGTLTLYYLGAIALGFVGGSGWFVKWVWGVTSVD